ncbi:IATP ATPase inhibitor [Phanerochaete sordida]|uniref:ATPase inhibitor, mitochondrial n=1 Tax=Phanerochaete sordida TaxID=48140 RepID=A0A9P3GKI4_9APHY|nr:IATP ATPase inhibitor [Phanerochaete sordida]
MSSGQTAQDSTWKSREQAQEAQYAKAKEQEQLAAIRDKLQHPDHHGQVKVTQEDHKLMDRDFEGGFGGQEDLEDRYATTSGEH